MSDKEAVLEMVRNLPAEASLREILQGIEKITASQLLARIQVMELRSSSEAASVLNLALAAHHCS
jgi:hypothetical protein